MKDTFAVSKNYTAYVVDLDGTLYYKRWMQFQMLIQLIFYYLRHIHRFNDLRVIYSYRKMRDSADLADVKNFDQVIIRQLSQIYHCSENYVQQLIKQWILTRPLQTLFVARDQKLIAFINEQSNNNKKVFVYSDYPAVQKCKTLGISANDIYWPDSIRISVLKPSPKGLLHILQDNRLEASEVLFIGDRMEKDGLCALGAGVDYLILKKGYISRKIQYTQLAKRGINK